MGFANDFGMGPTRVQIRDPHETYLGQHGSHRGYHIYGALVDFSMQKPPNSASEPAGSKLKS